jgi:hypothetical protein
MFLFLSHIEMSYSFPNTFEKHIVCIQGLLSDLPKKVTPYNEMIRRERLPLFEMLF